MTGERTTDLDAAEAAVLRGPVPAAVRVGEDFITVARAWPLDHPCPDGDQALIVEGPDTAGRVRAARLHLRPNGDLGWTVTRAEVARPGRDRKLPGMREAAEGGTVVVHRFGRRAVIRHHDRFTKVVRPGRGAGITDLAHRGHVVATKAGFSAPEVLASGDDRAEFAVLPGASLHDLGSVAELTAWRGWWAEWARRWPAIAGGDRTGLGEHTADDEVAVLRRWTSRVERFAALPAALEASLAEQVAQVADALTAGTAQPLVVSHRDLHDKQLLAHGTSLGLLDFDTAALAEPALDLANLLVHVRLRHEQGLWSAEHTALAEAAVVGVVDELAVDRARLDGYAQATRLRLACLYAFRPRYRSLALAWADPKMRSLSSSSHPRST